MHEGLDDGSGPLVAVVADFAAVVAVAVLEAVVVLVAVACVVRCGTDGSPCCCCRCC